MAGEVVVVVVEYDGKEVAEDGRPESGYMALTLGDRVALHGAPAAGHSANRAPSYVYGVKLGPGGERGWFPSQCIASAGAA